MSPSLKRKAEEEKPTPDAMTLGQHLGELRQRLLVCAAVLVVASVAAFFLYNDILVLLKEPYCQVNPKHCGFYVTGPLDGLTLRIRISLYGGLVLSLPVLFFELWRFITPGLIPGEKKYAVPFVLSSVALFVLGAAVAYFTFPHALAFLDTVGGPSLTQLLDPSKYLTLVLLMMLIFGLSFEFPVLLVSLELAGVVTPKQLGAFRRWAIVIIVVVAGVITPSSDPFSMMALAVPLYLFYELSILVGKALQR